MTHNRVNCNRKDNRKYHMCSVLPALSLALMLLLTGCGENSGNNLNVAESMETTVDENAGAEKASTEETVVATDSSAGSSAGSTEKSPAAVELDLDGLTPITADSLQDGTYAIEVDSSSTMFRITACELTVADGKMTATMTMGGTGYLYVYMGTGADAEKASEEEYIPFVETESGEHTYTVPVEALDKGIDCAAFSKKKQVWYDRTLVFRSETLPQEAFAEGEVVTAQSLDLDDGEYRVAVTLEGGSGRTTVESPTKLTIKDGQAYATIIFSSSNYDYMIVGDTKYDPVTIDPNSTFEIPVESFHKKIAVTADTVAMSTPHEIDYTLYFDETTIEKAEE